LLAQNNYEIQVYPYELVAPGHTMIELHSNFTLQGTKQTIDGQYPTEHQLHETIEITPGFNDWFECGFYILPARKARPDGNGSAITSALDSTCRTRGNGRLA